MTVSSEVSTAGPYNGNGVTVIFPYGFKIVDETHLRVVLLDVAGAATDLSFDDGDYSVSGVGSDAGGNVTVVTPPATGEKLTIVRNPPLTQETDLENQGPYSAEVVESRFDLITMQIQKVKEATDRGLQVEPGQEVPSFGVIAAAEGFALQAQVQADRAEDEADRAEAFADLALNNWGHVVGVGNGIITDIPLAADPGSVANTIVNFDGILQMKSTYSLVNILGVTNVRFSSPIPDTVPYEIEYGNRTDLPTMPIPDASLVTAKYAPNSVTLDKLVDIATLSLLGRKTAGTGDPEVLTLSDLRDAFLPGGSVIDSAQAVYTANANLATLLPFDDTIPQAAEGTEILSVAITPKSTTNKLRIRFQGMATANGTTYGGAAMFVNGGANAVAASGSWFQAAGEVYSLNLCFEYVPAAITVQTITIRVGPNAGIMRMNGTNAARVYGGVAQSTVTVEEIKA